MVNHKRTLGKHAKQMCVFQQCSKAGRKDGAAIRILSDQHLQSGLFPYQGHMRAVEGDGMGRGKGGTGERDGSDLAEGNRAAEAQASASHRTERRVQNGMKQRQKQSRRCVFSDLEEQFKHV